MNNVLLADLYAQHAGVFRPQAEMNLVLGLAASLIGFFVFAYAYAKGYEGGDGAIEGLRFGVIVGLLLSCFAVVWNYVVLPMSGSARRGVDRRHDRGDGDLRRSSSAYAWSYEA